MLNWIWTMSEASVLAADAAPVPQAAGVQALSALPLLSKGLLTTAVGLLGVFLVLALFFVTIKAMQRFKVKDEQN